MTQLGERLAYGTKGIAHRSAVDLSLAGSKAALVVSMTKDLQDGNRVCVLFQGGVNEMFVAKGFPDVEGVVCSSPVRCADSHGEGTRNSAEVSLEVVSNVSGTSFHRGVTGNRLFN